MSPTELFDYADKIARAAETRNQGTNYPTVRQAAKHFRVTQVAIEDACDDFQGEGYLGLIVGIQTNDGLGTYASRGDCQVEAYK